MNTDQQLDKIIEDALQEDIGDGDQSTLCCIDKAAKGKAVLKIKQDGILAGTDIAEKIFRQKQHDIIFSKFKNDGEKMCAGEEAFEVSADLYTILQCERLVLNCMQRMCGIATLTKTYTERLIGFKTKLLDTRKTTPNFRLLEKKAVVIGGGVNHRFGLYDMIMLKDNHIDYCGGIEIAISKAYNYVQQNKSGLKIEIETRSINDVIRVVSIGKIDRIMLDNFTPEMITEALRIIGGRYETEASGGINYENIRSYAETGVDYISTGAIIHQAKSLDLSLKAVIM